jgi:CRP-like cAMP-binding protein
VLPQDFVSIAEGEAFVSRKAIEGVMRRTPMFCEYTRADMDSLLDMARIRFLRRKDIGFRQGRLAEGFYVLIHGSIVLEVNHGNGRRKIYGAFHQGEIFGESQLAVRKQTLFRGTALSDVALVRIPNEAFTQMLAGNTRLAQRTIMAMGARMHEMISQISDLRILDVEGRFLGWFVRHIPTGSASATVTVCRKRVLAAELGVTEVTLSRMFANLSKSGFAICNARQITIPDCKAFLEHFHSVRRNQ